MFGWLKRHKPAQTQEIFEMPLTLEEAQAQLAEAQAKLAQYATTDLTAAQKAKADAETAAAAAKAEAEQVRNDAEALKAAHEADKAAWQENQRKEAVGAGLREAALAAGARDVTDVLALLDRSKVKTDTNGALENGAELIAALKQSKPYLFGGSSSTFTGGKKVEPPPAQGQKKATEMTAEEWQKARAAVLARK
jgi:hypothetical protein